MCAGLRRARAPQTTRGGVAFVVFVRSGRDESGWVNRFERDAGDAALSEARAGAAGAQTLSKSVRIAGARRGAV